jgi:hypothetical protein
LVNLTRHDATGELPPRISWISLGTGCEQPQSSRQRRWHGRTDGHPGTEQDQVGQVGCARRIHQPGRRTDLQRLRQSHGPQRRLLQVPQLRSDERLKLMSQHLLPSSPGRLRNARRRPSLRVPQLQTPHCENALMPGWPRINSRVFSPLAVIRWISDPLNVLLKRVKVMFAPFGENPGSAIVMPSGA